MSARALVLLLLAFLAATDPGRDDRGPRPVVGAVPDELRERLRLDPFYAKHLDADGFPILASAKVADEALTEARDIVDRMLDGRDDVRRALVGNKVRLVLMAPDEMTTDVPEQRGMTPKDYWDRRARGLGASRRIPVVSCGEENLLNLRGDRYRTENILVHEFAHTIHTMGLRGLDPTFDDRLRAAYDGAKAKGLWENTYAATDPGEYWAEGVQSYFDTNAPPGGVHNEIDSREELAEYDLDLFQLIDETFRGSAWRYVRYDKRHPAAGKAEPD